MPYRCPLCLNKLGGEQKLLRFCLSDNQVNNFHAEEIDCVQEPRKIYCGDKSQPCNYNFESGVFLLHVECDKTNPFWDEKAKTIKIPGDESPDFDKTASFPYSIPGDDEPPSHWQMSALRRLPRDRKEMWFPLALLRAIDEVSNSRRTGVLVELAGTRFSGKTVLTMQSMDQKGYVNPRQNGRIINLKHYMFSKRLEGADVNPLLDLFYLRDVMRRNHAYTLPEGNNPGENSLKAIFIKPNKKTEAEKSSMTNEMIETAKRNSRTFLRDLWRDFLETLKEIFGLSKKKNLIATDDPFWYGIVFYDTAGEDQKKDHADLEVLENNVEKVAVIIRATDIFDLTRIARRESSIVIANEKLEKLKDKTDLSICAVVTHIDELLNDEFLKKIGKNKSEFEKDVESARDFAENLNSDFNDDSIMREILLKWLASSPDTKEPHPNLTTLGNLLTEAKVFFVWTEGLPKVEGLTLNARTYSYGLARFICWCLGIKWNDINQG